MACRQCTRSSVQTLPVAPGANGQPPRPPIEASKCRTPHSTAARIFGIAMARVLCVCSVHSMPGNLGIKYSSVRRTWAGLAIPVVSARPMAWNPQATRRTTIASRFCRRTSISKGHPNEHEMPPCSGIPASCATCATAASLVSDSATVILTLARLWLSLADSTVWILSTPASTARVAPPVVGHQGGIDCPRSTHNTCHHLLSIPQLWHHLGMHKRRHLKAWHPDRTQPIHSLYFQLCRDKLWLNLKAIARPNLTNGDHVRWHQLSFLKATYISRTAAYPAHAAQRTPAPDYY